MPAGKKEGDPEAETREKVGQLLKGVKDDMAELQKTEKKLERIINPPKRRKRKAKKT